MRKCNTNCPHFGPFNLVIGEEVHHYFMCGKSFFYIKPDKYYSACEFNKKEIREYNDKVTNIWRRIYRWVLRKPKEIPY